MNKRLISFLMVVLLLASLVPMGAFAAIGETIIKTQPKDVSADVGDTVSFTIEAENPNSTNLKYLWFDAKQVNTDNINSFTSFIAEAEKAKLGDKESLTLKNITEDMDGMTVRCAVYYTDPIIPRGLSLSDTATLSIRPPECEEHTLRKIAASAATCAKEGNVEYYCCTVCERYYLDEAGTLETTPEACTIPKLTTHGNIVLVEARDASCCEKGCIEHWACEICGQAFVDEAGTVKLENSAVELAIDATKHTNLVHHDAVAATCCEQGTIEYWYCDGCDKYFTDAAGTESISKVKLDVDKDKTNHTNLVYYPPKAATCNEEGNIPYYYCDGCKDYFSDAEGTKEISKSDATLPKLDHSYKWVALNVDGVEYHAQECSKCGDLKNTGNHSGGEAYCAGRAVCDICGFEYGAVDPDNHIHTEKQIIVEPTLEKDGLCNIYCTDCEKIVAENVKISYDEVCEHELVKVEEVPAKCESCTDASGVKEHYKCSICGAIFSDADGKQPISDESTLTIEPLKHYIAEISGEQIANVKVQEWAYDEVGHWRVCKFCGYRYTDTYSTHTVLGNAEPTCCSGSTCVTCGYDDGKRDPNNHSGGTEIVGAVEPVGDEPGYTGDTKCLGCGEIIEQGRTYYAACPGGCAATLEFVPAVEKTCTEDGVKAHYICTVCGNMYLKSDGTQPTDEAGIVDPCTGHDLHPGKDAITSTDLASLMANLDISTDDLLAMIKNGDFSSLKDITYESLLANLSVKDIDHCYDDTYHWLGCQRCGKTLEDLRPELEKNGITINERWYELSRKTAHSGGVADCKNKAICDECGEAYGDFGKHRYDAVVTEPTCTEKGYTTHTCSGCNDSYVDSYTPAAGHKINKGRCENCKQNFPNPFVDVESGSVYYEHVLWAYYYDPQITAGTDATHFSPSAPCTRGQVVTFLWRAAGRPQPTSTSISFSDVMNSGACQPYYTAILWAAENGITTGYSDGTFRPHAQVKRAEFVTFLWRYYGQPSPSNLDNPFVDVSPNSVFYKAILWAAEQGITQGYGNNDFQPNRICSRWQVVTFLHRAMS
ncbi:MAG: S-layer homology domain-containing protein [Oscillospiraceae bacterium]